MCHFVHGVKKKPCVKCSQISRQYLARSKTIQRKFLEIEMEVIVKQLDVHVFFWRGWGWFDIETSAVNFWCAWMNLSLFPCLDALSQGTPDHSGLIPRGPIHRTAAASWNKMGGKKIHLECLCCQSLNISHSIGNL